MSNAMTALELISRLCAESAWAWIDGMLLAGCLAYGLGNYNDALTWYSKILEIDTKSVQCLPQAICIGIDLVSAVTLRQYQILLPPYFPCIGVRKRSSIGFARSS